MSTFRRDNLRVLLVNKFFHPVIGGIETHVRDLAVYLPEYVERKVLVCSEDKKGKVEFIDGVEVVKVPSLGVFFSSPLPVFFGKELKRFSKWADIFHFHFPFPPGEVSYVLSAIGNPLVVTYHSDIVRQKALLQVYRPLLVKFLERASAIIATSPTYVETSPVLAHFKEKCKVIPLGIDTNVYELNDSIKLRVRSIKEQIGSPFVLFVGRLIYYKGVQYLLEAFREVPEPFKLVIVGKGPLETHLRNLAHRLNLAHRVVFFGPLPFSELLAFFHACEIFVLPSVERTEAFGIVLLEAQACKKPVISTELGTGTSFVNQHEHTGLVVPPGDSSALAGAIVRLLEDERLRKQFGENAYKRVRNEFDVKVMAERVAKLYREVLS